MIDFTITDQVIEFNVGEEVTFDIVEAGEQVIVFEQVGSQGPRGEQGLPGPVGPIANLNDIDLPDFTLLFENQLV